MVQGSEGKGGAGIPEKRMGKSRWKRVARFRLRNKMREGRYREGEERRKCRLCGNEEESWEHVWEMQKVEGRRRRMAGGGRMDIRRE